MNMGHSSITDASYWAPSQVLCCWPQSMERRKPAILNGSFIITVFEKVFLDHDTTCIASHHSTLIRASWLVSVLTCMYMLYVVLVVTVLQQWLLLRCVWLLSVIHS